MQGYGLVIRSAGSKTPVDIVAFAEHEVLFVQCKRHGAISSTEWNVLFDLAQRYDAIAILAHKDAGKLKLFRITGNRKPRSHAKPMELF